MFKTGKLPISFLDVLLKKYTGRGRGLVIGPQVGMDAAVIKWGKTFLVGKTDPITFTSFDLGEYLVNINANDIACMGGVPEYLLVTLLLPEEGVKKADIERIFRGLSLVSRRLGICLCGGHTEITGGLSRPIAIGSMLGEIKEKRRVYPPPCREGDKVVLVKGIAIEGTAILAREKGEDIQKRFGTAFLKRALRYIRSPGISVVKEAEIAWRESEVKAMHDPTEQGLSAGLYELSIRLDMGILVDKDIPILPECRKLCSYFSLDPFGLISSGALLVVVGRSEERLMEIYKRKGIEAAVIGHLIKRKGVWLRESRGLQKFPCFGNDEITKVL